MKKTGFDPNLHAGMTAKSDAEYVELRLSQGLDGSGNSSRVVHVSRRSHQRSSASQWHRSDRHPCEYNFGWVLTSLLLWNTFQLYAIIVISGLFGISEGFLYPAILALLPRIVRKSQLGQTNAWMQGSEQISNVIGPAIAGLAIGAFGLTTAFGLNTALFAMGTGCIYLVRIRSSSVIPSLKSHSLTEGILEGLRYAWNHQAIRVSLLLIALINFAVLGPIVVGVAELVTVRLGSDATTFGYLQSAYGIGALLGVWLASQLHAIKQLQTPLLMLAGGRGIGLIALGLVHLAETRSLRQWTGLQPCHWAGSV